MFQQIIGQDDHLGFSLAMKNINLVEDLEDLLLVKFRFVELFSVVAELGLKNLLANQRTGRSS